MIRVPANPKSPPCGSSIRKFGCATPFINPGFTTLNPLKCKVVSAKSRFPMNSQIPSKTEVKSAGFSPQGRALDTLKGSGGICELALGVLGTSSGFASLLSKS
jgi:hypothetical protein